MSISNKEKEKRVQIFEKAIRFFQVKLGLINLEINVFQEETEEDERLGYRACFYSIIKGQIISIAYSEDWIIDKDLTLEEICRVAFHEIYEISFDKMRALLCLYYAVDYVAELVHIHVRRMEKLIYPQWFEEFKKENKLK